MVSAGLDGTFHEPPSELPTSPDYDGFIDGLVRPVSNRQDPSTATLVIGISTPGLMDRASQQVLLSPNLAMTNDRSPARDLEAHLDVPCVMLQESHALHSLLDTLRT